MAAGRDADSDRVAGVEGAFTPDVGDMVGGVPRRGEAVQAEDPVAHGVHVLLGDGRELAPERVERLPVEAPRAGLEPPRIDQMRRSDRRDVHLERGVLADERACRACMVEVDVGEKEVGDVRQRKLPCGETSLELSDAGRRTAVEEGRTVVSVRDNGPGIDPAIADKIFDPFFTTKDVGEGMGLGLSISYRIIEECGGRISVRSEPGKFAEFLLVFPSKA